MRFGAGITHPSLAVDRQCPYCFSAATQAETPVADRARAIWLESDVFIETAPAQAVACGELLLLKGFGCVGSDEQPMVCPITITGGAVTGAA